MPYDADQLDARATTVSPAEAAERLGIRESTLANMRWSGRGPTYVKVGGRVRYRIAEIAEYLDAQARSSTSAAATTNAQRWIKED